jgi:hypothetical protein
MASEQYLLDFTDGDASKSFTISPYTTNGNITPTTPTLDSGAVSANTSLIFYGKGKADYGERINENFLHILENFASDKEPLHPIQGQVWFDTKDNSLKVFKNKSFDIVSVDTTNKKITIKLAGESTSVYAGKIVEAAIARFSAGYKFSVFVSATGSFVGDFLSSGTPVATTNPLEIEIPLVTVSGIDVPTTPQQVGGWIPVFDIDPAIQEDILSGTKPIYGSFVPRTHGMDMGGYRISNLGPATSSTDALSKGHADTLYASLSGTPSFANGFTTGGDIILTNNAVISGLSMPGTPSSGNAITYGFLSTNYINKDGSVEMSADLILNGPITNPLSAATKQYVDNAAQSLSNLSDVSILNLADANVIKYDLASATWKNVPTSSLDAGLLGGNPSTEYVRKSAGGDQTISSGPLVLEDQPEQPGQTVPSLGKVINHAATVGYVDGIIDTKLLSYNGTYNAFGVILGSNGSAPGSVKYTAIAQGSAGTAISVSQNDPGAPGATLSVNATGNFIVVSLATDASGTITTTANDIFTAIQNDANASAIVVPSVPSGDGVASAGGPVNLQLPTLSDIHVDNVMYDTTLDQLNFFRTDGNGVIPDIAIGNFGKTIFTSTKYDITPITKENGDYNTSVNINSLNWPVPVNKIVDDFSITIKNLGNKIKEKVVVSDGRTTPYDIGLDYGMKFTAGHNQVQVFVDGVKKYPNQRAHQEIILDKSTNPSSVIDGIYPSAPTGLVNDSTVYSFTVSDPAGFPSIFNDTVNLVGSENQYFWQLLVNINGGLLKVGNSMITKASQLTNSKIVIEEGKLILYSNVFSTNGTPIGLEITADTLFGNMVIDSNLVVVQPENTEVIYDYYEIGTYGLHNSSGQIQFNTTIPTSNKIEFIIYPNGGKDVNGNAI